MGLIYATIGEHETAVEQFIAATRLDNYLAVALVPLPILPHHVSSSANSSYFQCGVSNFLLGRYDLSSKDFEEALLYLRGNQSMCVACLMYDCLGFEHSCNLSSNYTQLGLAFTLYSAEVLFNKGNSFVQHNLLFSSKRTNSLSGLSLIYLGQVQEGIAELQDAASQKATEEHSVIDEALRDRGEGYTVFSIVRPK